MKIIYTFLLLLYVISPLFVFSQDLILKKNGDEIKSKVVEILKTEIKYKKFENLSGPVYSIDITEVFMVRYENGSKDVFNQFESYNKTSNKESVAGNENSNQNQFLKVNGIDIGRVSPIGNKLVFVNSVPIAKYEVVFTFQNLMNFQDLPVFVRLAENSIRNANIEAANQNKLYDAIITQSESERDIAIKFTTQSEDNNLCRVSKINGILAFIGSEPITKYNTVRSWYAIHTSGDNPIFGDYQANEVFHINKAINWGNRKKIDFDALIYNKTREGYELFIKF
jgi:hypothetical protein